MSSGSRLFPLQDIGRAAEILNRASGVPGSERQVRLNKAALEMSNVILTERAGPDARWADASSSQRTVLAKTTST